MRIPKKAVFRGVAGWCKRNATKILSVTAIASEAVGFYCMHKEAPIVRDKLDELGEDAKWYEKAKVALPVYLPAIFCFTVSSGSIVGALVSGEKKVAAISSLEAVSSAMLRKTEEKVVEMVGPEKAKEIHEKVAQEILDENPITMADDAELTGYGNILFYEPLNGRYFRSSLDAVKNANADFRGHVSRKCWGSLNDWYVHLGIRESETGDYFGWNIGHNIDAWFDEGHSTTGELCWVIRHINKPVLGNGKAPTRIEECEEVYDT